MRLLRLFNDAAGRRALVGQGVDPDLVAQLDLLGISGIGNLMAAIKFAKYSELTADDVVVTIATDSMQLYGSRLRELADERGEYDDYQAHRDLELLDAVTIDHMKELGHYDRKTLHNLKYFTWIEQQGRALEELNAQWADHDRYWQESLGQQAAVDALIEAFNDRVGLP